MTAIQVVKIPPVLSAHQTFLAGIAQETSETLAKGIIGMFGMIDFNEAGGKEPRRTARYRQVLETRKFIETQLLTIDRAALEAIFQVATSKMYESSIDLRKRIADGQDPALPAAKRTSRRKPGSVPTA